MHTALEEWERSGREVSMSDLHELYLTAYREEANELVEKFPNEGAWLTGGRKKGFDDLTEREGRGWWQVEDYIDWAGAESEFWRVAEVEVGFSITLGGVEVVGYIDQVTEWRDGTISAADLKTGAKLPSSPIQLIVYDYALTQMGYNTVSQGDWIHLGKPATARVKARPAAREIIDLQGEPLFEPDRLHQLFFDLDRGIEGQVFLPNPGESCARTCGVAQFCRAMGHPDASASRTQGIKSFRDNPWNN